MVGLEWYTAGATASGRWWSGGGQRWGVGEGEVGRWGSERGRCGCWCCPWVWPGVGGAGAVRCERGAEAADGGEHDCLGGLLDVEPLAARHR